jgi:transcriptional regulator with XRE-family HTH domain
MTRTGSAARRRPVVGDHLRHWRTVRGMSQLELGMRAGVSTRHLSFVESGRANASREMLELLADALDVPLRERNALLGAAGFAQAYPESSLEGEDLAAVRRALSSMLERLDPYPCIVIDRHWNVTLANGGAMRLLSAILAPDELAQLQPLNAARLLFHPVMRPRVANWEAAAGAFVQRLHREALSGDPSSRALLDEVVSMPGVPKRWRMADLDRVSLPVIPVELVRGDVRFRLFTTLTTLGTPLDVTLQELRIETYFPADDATDAALRALHLAP